MSKKRSNLSDEWILRLYVAGQSARSAAALRNLEAICEEHLAGRYRIEVIDLLKHPQLARGDPDRRRAHARPSSAPADEKDHRRPVQRGKCPGWTRLTPRRRRAGARA